MTQPAFQSDLIGGYVFHRECEDSNEWYTGVIRGTLLTAEGSINLFITMTGGPSRGRLVKVPYYSELISFEPFPFKVRLLHAGDHPISVIRAIRQVTGFGLKQCKDLVDRSQGHWIDLLMDGEKPFTFEEASSFVAELVGVGAQAEVISEQDAQRQSVTADWLSKVGEPATNPLNNKEIVDVRGDEPRRRGQADRDEDIVGVI